jgi:hypothetical protein
MPGKQVNSNGLRKDPYLTLFSIQKQGHFARNCKEENERCYRCNGKHFFPFKKKISSIFSHL